MGQTCSQLVENITGGRGSDDPFDIRTKPTTPQLLSYQREAPTPSSSSSKTTYAASTNPADYTAVGLQGMKWERFPGQINDQRINIDRCNQSQFFLIDHCDSVQIDECHSCVFFIGPTSGSVFIRNCTDCVFVVACGQLRLRDVKRATISLFTRSRPVLESSHDIRFACFSARHQYFALETHLRKAQMSSFNNLFWFVHDFTPGGGGKLNYSFMTQTEFESSYDVSMARLQELGNGYATTFDAVPVLSAGVPEYISPDEDLQMYLSEVAIPYVVGLSNSHQVVPQECLYRTVMVFSGDGLDEARRLVRLVEIQRREYYALQGLGPTDQQVFLLGTMEKIISLEDMSNILSVTSIREFWTDALVNLGATTTDQEQPRGSSSNVVHLTNKDPRVVESAVKYLHGRVCICICLASFQENPPLLAGPRMEIARSQRNNRSSTRGEQQQQLLLDISRGASNNAMMRLLDILLCKIPLGGSGFGASH